MREFEELVFKESKKIKYLSSPEVNHPPLPTFEKKKEKPSRI